jgi:Flp pilus assembly protein TadG
VGKFSMAQHPNFWQDKSGQFALMTAIATVPLIGALALAIDYTEISRQRQNTVNALDAAGIATARAAISGKSDAELEAYAKNFFKANLSSVDPDNTTLTVKLPRNNTGGGTLKLSADLTYKPYFYSAFVNLIYNTSEKTNFTAHSEIVLKNTLEVALVLDNSGSMNDIAQGSSKSRMALLKEASKSLLDIIALQAGQMKQVHKPVQFSLVPFAASVNVGPGNKSQTWMDTNGISPVHHENFDWSTMAAADSTKKVELSGGAYYRRGVGWGTKKDTVITRFDLYDEMTYVSGTNSVQIGTERVCTGRRNPVCVDKPVYEDQPVLSKYSSWTGCVETRPFPYNTDDTAATSATPASMFVPMFGPDETDTTSSSMPANNNWLGDKNTGTAAQRQRYMPKYFQTLGFSPEARSADSGPNVGCTTKPITTLTDITTAAGISAMKSAVDGMVPLGGTNVAEGVAWGWRSISSGAPFTEGRPDTEKGNDKVLIVLTDGANTYYTPGSVIGQSYSGFNNTGSPNYGGNDLAGSRSIYSSFGYVAPYNSGTTYGRLFQGVSSNIPKTSYSNANYSKALDEQMSMACNNAKSANVIIMTIALDLDPTQGTLEQKTQTSAQINGLTNCASTSRFKAGKLFWNTKGGDLDKTFKEIADELSNLRIVG